jgi:alkyl hydroperoxide reductase subunit AhpC
MRIAIIISVFLAFLWFMDFGYFYSPLEESEMDIIFKHKKGFHKVCSKDFLGFNTHSELFEMYVCKVEDASINTYFPKISKWEGKALGKGAEIAEWKNCPLTNDIQRLFGNISKLGNFQNFIPK